MSLEPASSLATPEVDKINLMGLSASGLGDLFEQMGEKRFRGTQILKWIHQMGVCDLDQMTNLSRPL
ncbi:MAG: 23S rRNA (adenine(2503)-C(2))-methyltransferase RlmN, partial [Cellvibrionales bacterium]